VRRAWAGALAVLGGGALAVGWPARAWAAGTSGPAPALPLLRWSDAVATLHRHELVGGVAGAGDPFLAALASLLLQLSALVWQALGSLVTAAQGSAASTVATDQVDPLYQHLGGLLLGAAGASLVGVVVVVGAVLAGWRAVRRHEGAAGAARGLAGVLVPVAVLIVTVHAAAVPGSRGSPGWALSRVSGWTTAVSGSVAALGTGLTAPAAGPDERGSPPGPACSSYLAGLDRQYANQAAAAGAGPATWQGGDALLLSHLWEGTVMDAWERAQFGSGYLGARTYCHLLEIQAGTSAADQLRAMGAATTGTGGGPTWSQLLAATGGSSAPAGVLGPQFPAGDDDLRRTMVAWAACDFEGGAQGWVVDPAFTPVHPGPSPGSCRDWWGQGTTTPTAPGAGSAGPFDFQDQRALVTATTGAPDARAYVDALDGQGTGSSLDPAVVALVSSVTFGVTLGGLALGVLVGKLSLILLMATLPLVLLLAAIPTATTRGAARRAAGLAVASLASTALFSTLLGVVLLLTSSLQAASAQLLPAAGDLAGLTSALVPLAALFVLRRLLRLADAESAATWRGVMRVTATLGRAGVMAGIPPARPEVEGWVPLVAGARPGRGSSPGAPRLGSPFGTSGVGGPLGGAGPPAGAGPAGGRGVGTVGPGPPMRWPPPAAAPVGSEPALAPRPAPPAAIGAPAPGGGAGRPGAASLQPAAGPGGAGPPRGGRRAPPGGVTPGPPRPPGALGGRLPPPARVLLRGPVLPALPAGSELGTPGSVASAGSGGSGGSGRGAAPPAAGAPLADAQPAATAPAVGAQPAATAPAMGAPGDQRFNEPGTRQTRPVPVTPDER
jgi:hypothetical protein